MLLLVPLEKKIELRRFPVITILLILINAIVFFVGQANDDKKQEEAVEYYADSGLGEIEVPLYLKYLETADGRGDSKEDKEKISYMKDGLKHNKTLVYSQGFFLSYNDNKFIDELLYKETIITREDAKYSDWKHYREVFYDKLSGSLTYGYGFISKEKRPITYITTQFLHGGVMHLVGNMVFLLFLGIAVENIFGSFRYIFFYLIGGCAATAFYSLFTSDSMIPLVGASGAIAGLMGMYAVSYGFRKINFFYNILFYFNYVKAPALIMFPLWLGNEFLQYYANEGSNVAYMAHAGGLIGGASIAAFMSLFKTGVDREYMDENVKHDNLVERMDEANTLMGQLEFDKAKRIYRQVVTDHPYHLDALKKLFTIEKHKPESLDFLSTCNKIFKVENAAQPVVEEINKIFKEYLVLTNNSAQLDTPHMIGLAIRFCNHGFLEDAERVITAAINSGHNVNNLNMAIRVFARELEDLDPSRSLHYKKMLAD